MNELDKHTDQQLRDELARRGYALRHIQDECDPFGLQNYRDFVEALRLARRHLDLQHIPLDELEFIDKVATRNGI